MNDRIQAVLDKTDGEPSLREVSLWCDEVTAIEAQLSQARQWVNDLQSGMYINCVYCGHRYGPNPGTPVAMADVLKQHIATCPEHPMSELIEVLGEAEGELENFNPAVAGRCAAALFRARHPK
jgi:hypothetical protein